MSALRVAVMARRGPDVPELLAPVVAAVWAALTAAATMAVLLLAAGVSRDDLAGPTGLAWLIAHHTQIITPDGAITLLPLGLMLIPLLAIRRATRWLICRSPGSAFKPLGAAFALYVAGGVTLAATIDVAGFRGSVLSAVITVAGVAAAGGFWGFRKQAETSLMWPGALAGVGVAFGIAIAIGSLLVAVTVAADASTVMDRADSAQMGVAELVGLAIIRIVYLPNAVVWAAGYAMGPGVSIGGGSVLSPYVGASATPPDLPLLGSLPETSPAWTALLPIVMVLAGALAGVTAHRTCGCANLAHRLGRAAILSGGTVTVWFAAASLAGGTLRGGRLEWIGSAPGTSLAAGALVGLGAVVWALLPTLVSDARPMAQDVGSRIGAGLAKKPPRKTREPTSVG